MLLLDRKFGPKQLADFCLLALGWIRHWGISVGRWFIDDVSERRGKFKKFSIKIELFEFVSDGSKGGIWPRTDIFCVFLLFRFPTFEWTRVGTGKPTTDP
jgi:hypothetical protein